MRTLVLLLTGLVAAAPQAAAQSTDSDCIACHGELEYLRQQAPSMRDARRLLVTHDDIRASAHREETCGDCHTGYAVWPHPGRASTRTCASCHEAQDTSWLAGVHAVADDAGETAATCADCHGVHSVADSSALHDGEAMRVMNGTCVSCHEASAMPVWDAHRDTVSCAGCHAAHETRLTDEVDAQVAPWRQFETCGACHEEAAEKVRDDAHGRPIVEGLPRGLADAKLRGADAAPTCSFCHGGHGIRAVEDPEAPGALLETCATCHGDPADRYFGTYHGKATALGSVIVATCADCHGAHGVYGADEPASKVHESNIVETCAACHETSSAAFVAYDSHPDPLDRSRNAPLFYAFVFMNGLLLSVLVVFGLHTLLWWVRILIDHRAGTAHGGDHA